MRRLAVAIAIAYAPAAGCRPSTPAPGNPPPLVAPSLASQRAKLYPEAAAGRFVVLADFEQTGRQVRHFALSPAGPSTPKYVVHITRTGIGGLEATVPPGSELLFRTPVGPDLDPYALLVLAVHVDGPRSDFYVTLEAGEARRSYGRRPLEKGWNTVRLDIRALTGGSGFGPAAVRAIRMGFTSADTPVRMFLDDVLLVDNRRVVRPVPAGVMLRKHGLAYRLHLPGAASDVVLAQGDDGLWRLGAHQPLLRLSESPSAAGEGEDISLMGDRRFGLAEVLEHNRVRVRLASTWYFPDAAGPPAARPARFIRWVHTFYPDGRHVGEVAVANPGGRRIGSASIVLPAAGVWPGRGSVRRFDAAGPDGSTGRWRWLSPGRSADVDRLSENYLHPPALVSPGGGAIDPAQGRFDPSEGCYVLEAVAGRCRFRLVPPPGGLIRPVFRVSGPWPRGAAVSSEGQAIRDVEILADGSALFVLGGTLVRPRDVEVAAAGR